MRPTYDAFATSQSALELPSADWWRGPSSAANYTLFSLNMCVSADAAHGLLPFFVMLKARERTPLGERMGLASLSEIAEVFLYRSLQARNHESEVTGDHMEGREYQI